MSNKIKEEARWDNKEQKGYYSAPPREGELKAKVMIAEERIIQETERLQEDMHKHIEWMMAKNKKLSYDECITVFILMKIAQLNLKQSKK